VNCINHDSDLSDVKCLRICVMIVKTVRMKMS
jgi:hypothetical protein